MNTNINNTTYELNNQIGYILKGFQSPNMLAYSSNDCDRIYFNIKAMLHNIS